MPPATEVKAYLLEDAWADFVAWKSWGGKVEKGAMRYFEFIKCCLGNIDVSKVTKQSIKSLLSCYASTPRRNIKPYHLLTPMELLQLEAVNPKHLVSSKTVKELFKLCQSFFSRYLTKEVDVLTESPTSNIKFESCSTRFAVFSDNEVRAVESFANEYEGWRRWVLLIAIYSGARRSEITGLKVSDIRFDKESNRHYLWIAEGKTKAATRRVPIHQKLLDEGFLSYVSQCDDSLFPELARRSNALTAHLHKSMQNSLITTVNDLGERKVFHSFRHTFITKSRASGVELGLIQEVVGHEKTESGITKRYTHSYPLRSLLAVIDGIDFRCAKGD
ncbi:tyrosine-type recombinase/integrase [Shewanella sp. WPAGA9]|uniref:tyrosine-type recombinase/integrase n=1 Tax=Shewanella sp. ENK2 TaxID=2775245 RepID=UPI001783F70B|nr:tyrosine-type recombinase/integrase [Shewanella sp. WPAGA9]